MYGLLEAADQAGKLSASPKPTLPRDPMRGSRIFLHNAVRKVLVLLRN